jgi:protein-S-isoprenylcysteine O-methyltransferase Ste14
VSGGATSMLSVPVSPLPVEERPGAVPVPLDQVQGLTTGILGVGVFIGGILLAAFSTGFAQWVPSADGRASIVLGAMFAVMASYEIALRRVHARNFDFTAPRALDAAARGRIALKLFALAATLATAIAAYALFPHYDGDYYAKAFADMRVLAGVALALAVPYFWLCERFGRWHSEDDDLLAAARGYVALIRRQRPNEHFWTAQRSFLVKFFFVPLMLTSLYSSAGTLTEALRALANASFPSPVRATDLGRFYRAGYHGIFTLDLALAILGYLSTFRLLDTHVRSAQPHLVGWLVALACYRPLNSFLNQNVWNYSTQEHGFGMAFEDQPVLYGLCACAILVLLAIYVSATVPFGLRFSNLTHRGILCRGPYAIVRHPAYISKNLAWWLINVPFLSNPGDCLRLLIVNAIYLARALTEEAHLKEDPAYRTYMAKVRWRFIPGIV